jgi:xanthine dehydrogenase accessory factor
LTTPNREYVFDILDAHSAFLTLFHDHDWEPHLLRSALTKPMRFIGSLGSHRTHDMRCDTLRHMGVSDTSLARLRGPIGLVPSLRDASSIAVSALAEIVATFQNADV